jgi:membrane protein YqaA with SNARE-associated domain
MGYGAHEALDHLTHHEHPAKARALVWLQRFGPPACLLSWLPVIGDPLCAGGGLAQARLLAVPGLHDDRQVLPLLVMTAVLLWSFPGTVKM